MLELTEVDRGPGTITADVSCKTSFTVSVQAAWVSELLTLWVVRENRAGGRMGLEP